MSWSPSLAPVPLWPHVARRSKGSGWTEGCCSGDFKIRRAACIVWAGPAQSPGSSHVGEGGARASVTWKEQPWLIARSEGGGRGLEPRCAGASGPGTGKEQTSPEPPEGTRSCGHLDFTQQGLFRASELWNSRITRSCCFKRLNLRLLQQPQETRRGLSDRPPKTVILPLL